MVELQETHKITLKILKELPLNESITFYKLKEKTKNINRTLLLHVSFLEKLKLVKVEKKYQGKMLLYELSLTKLGKEVVKGL